ncbi:ABC transporter permease [Streptacidiphilus jiangxiensis]|uniref:Peptide/nickel transport system permease protein n=1 Tax=Streptacidiphilus jiangxiensis TaxID=235985 RepID=A0A1H7TT92_STRJI|nr:ABC transporter permease [Streptacidiphilus jiangxiensis]SEL87961.1 peptide/nickel transport system permease protein [Streptacidiphilus jiangxiensis]
MRFLTQRLAQSALVIAGVVALTFVITRLVPGDPAVTYAGPRATPAQLTAVRRQLGLGASLPDQLWRYVTGLLRGDWGTSLHTRRGVLTDISTALPASLELVGCAMVLAVVVGVPLGLLGAHLRLGGGRSRGLGRWGRWGRWGRAAGDGSVRATSMLAVSVPVFLLALAVQNLFAAQLGWFPVAGEYTSKLNQTSPLEHLTHLTVVDALLTGNWPVLDSALAHLVLPALVMAAYPVGVVAQMSRAALLEESAAPHARLERAYGFSRLQVLTRFSLRPASGPLLALLALVFAFSLVNAFLVEEVFDWPGLGRYASAAITSSDAPAIAGVTVVVALTYVVTNLLVDLTQAVIDPRVRL